MGGWKNSGHGRWHYFAPAGEREDSRSRSCGPRRQRKHASRSSGNHAFDEYREETLRRLEDEQKEFHDFLEHLRQAKDKAEFDEFMNDRRRTTVDNEPEAENKPEEPGPAPA